MDPYIILKIENHVPHLYYYQNGVEKKLTENDESISDIFLSLGEQLNLREKDMEDSAAFNHLLNIANASDDQYLEISPNIDIESIEFELESLMNEVLNEAKQIESKYNTTDLDLTDELKAEIDRNQNMDILASLFDIAYKIIIAKTLLAAYELEIKDIRLQNDDNYQRFTEKIARELENLDIEFSLLNSAS